MSWGSAIRTRISRLQRPAGCRLPHSPSRAACRSRTRYLGGTSSALWPDELTRHGYARRESNPHQPGPRPGPSTCCGTSARSLRAASNRLPVPYEGLEPRPRHRLRACRSTIELAAPGAVPGSRTPIFCLEGKCLPLRPVRHGGSRRYRTFLLQVFGLALIRLS